MSVSSNGRRAGANDTSDPFLFGGLDNLLNKSTPLFAPAAVVDYASAPTTLATFGTGIAINLGVMVVLLCLFVVFKKKIPWYYTAHQLQRPYVFGLPVDDKSSFGCSRCRKIALVRLERSGSLRFRLRGFRGCCRSSR